MHALGMWHEQQRIDRDSYIKILKENIENPQDTMVNYEKYNTANDLPYDVESIMQYGLRVRIMSWLHSFCDISLLAKRYDAYAMHALGFGVRTWLKLLEQVLYI